jgi:hypothetical protein
VNVIICLDSSDDEGGQWRNAIGHFSEFFSPPEKRKAVSFTNVNSDTCSLVATKPLAEICSLAGSL